MLKTQGAEEALEGISYQSGILAQIDKNCLLKVNFSASIFQRGIYYTASMSHLDIDTGLIKAIPSY